MNCMNEADDNLGQDAYDDDEFPPELPPPDFDFLVYSLRLQAELNMGLLPYGEQRKPDFDLGRHTIDLLAMLQEKTKGNLTLDEQRSLDNSLTELRFRFVEAKEQYAKDELAKKVDGEQANQVDSAPQDNQQPA